MVENEDLRALAHRYEISFKGMQAFLAPGDDLNEPEEFRHAIVCQRFVFSDTVILISTDDQERAAFNVLLHAWRLSQWFISVGLPLRGGVAFGELYANPREQVFLGRALTAAHALEQAQKWIGTSISPGVVERFPALFPSDPSDLVSGLFPLYDVPTKTGPQRMRTINWRAQFVAAKGIQSLLPKPTDAESATKIANTLSYAKEMRQRGYALRVPCPHLMAPVVIGDEVPPNGVLVHGDEF